MKILKSFFVILSIFAFSCDNGSHVNKTYHFENDYVSIDFETIYIREKWDLYSAVVVDGIYYAFFEKPFDITKQTTNDWENRKFCAFTKNGEKIFELDAPQEIKQVPYFYLHQKNDSIIVTSSDTLYFDKDKLMNTRSYT